MRKRFGRREGGSVHIRLDQTKLFGRLDHRVGGEMVARSLADGVGEQKECGRAGKGASARACCVKCWWLL